MNDDIKYDYDVFLSHSSDDKDTVRKLATRLRDDGLSVWLDEWIIRPGDSIPQAIERGLECSRVLVLVMSQHSVGKDSVSEWVTFERHTLLFRDPGNSSRRFIPLLVDDVEPKASLQQYLYVDWRRRDENGYVELLSCLKTNDDIQTLGTTTATSQQSYVEGLRRMVQERLSQQFQLDNRPVYAYPQGHATINYRHSNDEHIVFRAYDTVLRRFVAIKVPHLPAHDAARFASAFHLKMSQVSQLKHRNILYVYAGLVEDGLPMLIREYVHGKTLGFLIERCGPQPLVKVCRYIKAIGGALDYAHQRHSIHHKLAPNNILIDAEGQPVITPFSMWGDDHAWISDSALKYAAPEHFIADRVSPHASDQYALGLIAYEMIVGAPYIQEHPRDDKDEFERAKERFCGDPTEPPSCHPSLWKVISTMLQRDAEDRWDDLGEMLDAVDVLIATNLGRVKPEYSNECETAQKSYNRCRVSSGFFERFYERLNGHATINGIFDKYLTGENAWVDQHWILGEAIDLLLQFPMEGARGQIAPKRIVKSHAKMQIVPEMYDEFMECILKTVAETDHKCSAKRERERILQAWERTLQAAIEFMKSETNAEIQKQPSPKTRGSKKRGSSARAAKK